MVAHNLKEVYIRLRTFSNLNVLSFHGCTDDQVLALGGQEKCTEIASRHFPSRATDVPSPTAGSGPARVCVSSLFFSEQMLSTLM